MLVQKTFKKIISSVEGGDIFLLAMCSVLPCTYLLAHIHVVKNTVFLYAVGVLVRQWW